MILNDMYNKEKYSMLKFKKIGNWTVEKKDNFTTIYILYTTFILFLIRELYYTPLIHFFHFYITDILDYLPV